MTTIPKLDFKVIDLLNELIFAIWRAGEPIGSLNTNIELNNLFN